MSIIINNYVYLASFIIALLGLYIIVTNKNLLVKIMGLGVFQGGIILFYILTSKINKSAAPVFDKDNPLQVLSNPLPHVLMLTAIVVGIATTSLACSFVYKIYKEYNTIDEEEINKINNINQ